MAATFIPSMLCERLTDPRRLSERNYIAEPKLDGQRAQLHIQHREAVACFSRRGLDLLRHPGMAWLREIAWPFESAIFDGEACAGDGHEGIQAVSTERNRAGGDMALVLFDVLHVAGKSVMREPWRDRRKRLRVRSAGRVVSVPVLGVVGVLPDGHKHLLALELCGGESLAAWKGCLDDLVARGLRAPVLTIIDGNAGLRRAVGLVWPRAAVQRCCVHKLRNLERKAPKHALAEIRDDFHRIVYAANADAARRAYTAFERTWARRCPGVVTSLREGGDELLTFFGFPKAQWKTLRTTNTIERLHGEFRRRVKTQGSLPSEDAAVVLLFSLVASGQIKLRRIDGWRKIAGMLSQNTTVAA